MIDQIKVVDILKTYQTACLDMGRFVTIKLSICEYFRHRNPYVGYLGTRVGPKSEKKDEDVIQL